MFYRLFYIIADVNISFHIIGNNRRIYDLEKISQYIKRNCYWGLLLDIVEQSQYFVVFKS